MSLILIALVAGTSEAQVVAARELAGIPPGRCRVPANAACGSTDFLQDVSPPPTNCDQVERVASRNRKVRVIRG